jgi:hypothetical protein
MLLTIFSLGIAWNPSFPLRRHFRMDIRFEPGELPIGTGPAIWMDVASLALALSLVRYG